MSSDEILTAARQRLITSEQHIREKAKEAEAKMWEAVSNAYENCYKLIYNKNING